MAQVFFNNFSTTLASAIATAGVTTAALTSTAGLSAIATGDYFYGTLSNSSETTFEVVRGTAISGTTVTIARGQDNTSAASSWASGSTFSIRPVAAEFRNTEQRGEVYAWTYMSEAMRTDVLAGSAAVDCTSAIQAAIDACNGGTVVLPAGVMLVGTGNTSISFLDNNSSLVGQGRDLSHGSVLKSACTSVPCILISTTLAWRYGGVFRDFAILGPQNHSNTDDGIQIITEAPLTFERIYINGVGRYGIQIGDYAHHCDSFVFREVDCQLCGTGVYGRCKATAQLNAIWFEYCAFSQNASHGMDLITSTGSGVRNSVIQGNGGAGIFLDPRDITPPATVSGTGFCIHENYFELNAAGNIKGYACYQASPQIINYQTNLSIVDNYFLGNISGMPGITASVILDGNAYGWKGLIYRRNTHTLTGMSQIDLNNLCLDNCVVEVEGTDVSATTAKADILNANTARIELGNVSPRTSTAPETTSADWLYQTSLDTVRKVVSQAVSVGSASADWRPIMPYLATAAPTTGTWRRGLVVWNSSAAPGSPIGWMCATAGTPGSWVALANL